MTKNKRFYQPRYPCKDAEPFLLMNHQHFEDADGPKVYWAGSSVDGFFPGTLSDDGTKFPRKNDIIRIPRCVRLAIGDGFGNEDILNGVITPFVQLVKTMVKNISTTIYFDHHAVGEGTLYTRATVPYGESFNSFDGGESFSVDPLYFTDNCLFGTDVITFGICSQSVSLNAVKLDIDGKPVSAPGGWPTVVDYFNAQYEIFGGYRLILQPAFLNNQLFPGATPTGTNAANVFLFDNLATESQGYALPDGWEIGPDFSFDLSYMEETIRTHWSL